MCVDSSTCVPLTRVKRLVWFMAGFHFKLNKNVTSFRLRFAHYKIQTNKYCCPHLFLFFSIIFSACALIGCYGILLTAADHCNSCISWHLTDVLISYLEAAHQKKLERRFYPLLAFPFTWKQQWTPYRQFSIF